MRNLTYISTILLLILTSCASHWEIQDSSSENMTLCSTAGTRTDIEAIIIPYRDSLDQVMNEVLCKSKSELVIDRPESDLGNWVTDLLLAQARMNHDGKIDAAMFNTGGLRAAIPAGDVSRRHIFELMPFDNELVLVTIPYIEVIAMTEYLALKGGEPVSDIRLIIEDGMVKESLIGGNPIEDRSYTILTSDYLSNGGDKMYFFTEGHRSERIAPDIKVRDAVIEQCIQMGNKEEAIEGHKDGRISYGR